MQPQTIDALPEPAVRRRDLPPLVDLLDLYDTVRAFMTRVDEHGPWVWPDGWKPHIDAMRQAVQR